MTPGSRLSRKWRVTSILTLTVGLVAAICLALIRERQEASSASLPAVTAEVPPDLAVLRPRFIEAVDAVQSGDPTTAIELLTSFKFGKRPVEDYRLYFLANAYQLHGRTIETRGTLAELWARTPRLIYWQDVGFTLGSLHSASGDWTAASEVFDDLAARSEHPAIAATARSEYIKSKFLVGDVGGLIQAARDIVVENPAASQSQAAATLIRQLSESAPDKPIPLAPAERMERAKRLIAAGRHQDAIREIDTASATGSVYPAEVALQKGIALHSLRQFEESNRELEPLTSGHFKYAIPALAHSAKNYSSLAAAINPDRYKTIVERKKVGTRKVRGKGKKTTTRPVYRNIKRTIKLVDLNAKKKKEDNERLRAERLRDLLLLPTETSVRKQTLLTLISLAEQKNQDDYMQEMLSELRKIDPLTEVGLQRFWDKGWTAYLAGDHQTARESFLFVDTTYRNPNVKRQARYWYARSIEKSNRQGEAKRIYQELVDVPFEDIYSVFARERGARRSIDPPNSIGSARDWREIAEKELSPELRIAYELTNLGLAREARLEVQRNVNDSNKRMADAVLADLHHQNGSQEAAFTFARRAFPELATVDQNQVPRYFIDLYYPLRYEEEIRANARKREVDPYLVMGLIRQESSYRPDVRSRVGATGLMQIMPATGRELGRRIYGLFSESRLTNPQVNIELGTYYLRQLINMFGGSEPLAVAAYNGGMGNVRKWRQTNRRPMDEFVESIPYSETRNYVKRVIMLKSTYRTLSNERRLPSGG